MALAAASGLDRRACCGGLRLRPGISLLLGGNALLLKLHETLLTGTLGLVLLVSVAIRKPLLRSLIQSFGGRAPNGAVIPGAGAPYPASQARIAARFSLITLAIGGALFANMLAHVFLALTFSTTAYLGASHVTTWIILGAAVAYLWWLRRVKTMQT
jgi:hypothetical protein